jgi:hypothetical protein
MVMQLDAVHTSLNEGEESKSTKLEKKEEN